MKITTYEELRRIIDAFNNHKLRLVILQSRPGIGKSFACEKLDNHVTINSHVTPLALFEKLKQIEHFPDISIVIDESETVFANPQLRNMLKQVCDTSDKRTINWWTTKLTSEGREPTELSVDCFAHVIITTNAKPKNDSLRAIVDRAHVYEFAPTNDEVIDQIKSTHYETINKEVIDFITDYNDSKVIARDTVSFRTYLKAVDSKNAGLVWECEILDIDNTEYQYMKCAKDVLSKMTTKQQIKLDKGVGLRKHIISEVVRIRKVDYNVARIMLRNFRTPVHL